MSNIVVMGGFTESPRMLEPVADEAITQGFGSDAEVITLREARRMDSERLRWRLAGKNVVSHSAGVITIPDASQRVTDRELPESLTIVAAPEPSYISDLVSAAAIKSVNHVEDAFHEPGLRDACRRVMAGNTAELLAHPIANLSMVPAIARFSTIDRVLDGEVAARNQLGYFMMIGDVFYGADVDHGTVNMLIDRDVAVEQFAGRHDELLIDPASVLDDIQDVYEVYGASRVG